MRFVYFSMLIIVGIYTSRLLPWAGVLSSSGTLLFQPQFFSVGQCSQEHHSPLLHVFSVGFIIIEILLSEPILILKGLLSHYSVSCVPQSIFWPSHYYCIAWATLRPYTRPTSASHMTAFSFCGLRASAATNRPVSVSHQPHSAPFRTSSCKSAISQPECAPTA